MTETEYPQREIDRHAIRLLNYDQLVDYTLDVIEERNDLINTRVELARTREALAELLRAYMTQRQGADIPDYTKAAIDAYIWERRPVGGFLYAVLTNDLFEAFKRADDNNNAAMFAIVRYVWNEMPSIAWGSEGAVNSWLAGES